MRVRTQLAGRKAFLDELLEHTLDRARLELRPLRPGREIQRTVRRAGGLNALESNGGRAEHLADAFADARGVVNRLLSHFAEQGLVFQGGHLAGGIRSVMWIVARVTVEVEVAALEQRRVLLQEASQEGRVMPRPVLVEADGVAPEAAGEPQVAELGRITGHELPKGIVIGPDHRGNSARNLGIGTAGIDAEDPAHTAAMILQEPALAERGVPQREETVEPGQVVKVHALNHVLAIEEFGEGHLAVVEDPPHAAAFGAFNEAAHPVVAVLGHRHRLRGGIRSSLNAYELIVVVVGELADGTSTGVGFAREIALEIVLQRQRTDLEQAVTRADRGRTGLDMGSEAVAGGVEGIALRRPCGMHDTGELKARVVVEAGGVAGLGHAADDAAGGAGQAHRGFGEKQRAIRGAMADLGGAALGIAGVFGDREGSLLEIARDRAFKPFEADLVAHGVKVMPHMTRLVGASQLGHVPLLTVDHAPGPTPGGDAAVEQSVRGIVQPNPATGRPCRPQSIRKADRSAPDPRNPLARVRAGSVLSPGTPRRRRRRSRR